MDKEEVKIFYDEYVTHQKKIGLNIRHYSILKKLKKAGLKKTFSVLEIGCGIGTLTYLLAKYLKSGKILATDISEQSIIAAKKNLVNFKNVKCLTADITELIIEEKFDFIILPDVLEHIPVEYHSLLFGKLSKLMKSDSAIAINIPFPYFNDWARLNIPDQMQIIDQALYTNQLLEAAYPNGLYLNYLESYSLWMEPYDYQWIIFKKPESVKNYIHVSKTEVVKRSLKIKYG